MTTPNLPVVLTPEEIEQALLVKQVNPFLQPDSTGTAWSSLDLRVPEQAWVYQDCRNQGRTTIDDYIGKRFVAVHMLAHKWYKTDEDTGEVVGGLRVYLFDAKWNTCSFAGGKALQCIQAIAGLVGLPPWPEGLPLDVGVLPGKGSHKMHVLRLPLEYMQEREKKLAAAEKRKPSK